MKRPRIIKLCVFMLHLAVAAAGCARPANMTLSPAEYLSDLPMDCSKASNTVVISPLGVRKDASDQLFIDLQLIGSAESAEFVALQLGLFLCSNPSHWLEVVRPSGRGISIPDSNDLHHFGGLANYTQPLNQSCVRILMPFYVRDGLLNLVRNGSYRVRFRPDHPLREWWGVSDPVEIDDSWHEFELQSITLSALGWQ
jgi:hypothetical protein